MKNIKQILTNLILLNIVTPILCMCQINCCGKIADLSGRKIILLLLVGLFISAIAFADYRITRGPDIGEIYFVGPRPSAYYEGIYHSTDFGETAVCVDSTTNAMSICADKTSGVLYYVTMQGALYISYDYGQYGSWQFICGGGYWDINSGRNEGEIFNSIAEHSVDYGLNFISHLLNGFFGSRLDSEIDNENNIGYINVSNYPIIDSLWLLITYDNFDNLEIQNVYNVNENPIRDLSRGTENGELYNFADAPKKLKYSSDYGENWVSHNVLNYGLDYKDMVGGRQEGEVYIYGYYEANMLTIEHVYIFHSTDYGKTFTVFHPFSKGEEPLVANFSSAITEGSSPLTVQFCNYSVGDIQSYEWDFDNDGNIDSYEEEPEYTYQDTGYYSVKLTIYNSDDSSEFLRENYIHVTSNVGISDQLSINNYQLSVNNYPNPFNNSTIISYKLPENKIKAFIEIYNTKGQLIDKLSVNNYQSSIEWNAEAFTSGIYLYKLNVVNSPIKNMILMR